MRSPGRYVGVVVAGQQKITINNKINRPTQSGRIYVLLMQYNNKFCNNI